MSDPTEPMDDSDQLKCCPFCGSDPEMLTMPAEAEDNGAGAMFVQCTNSMCMASSCLIYPLGENPAPLLMEKWNRRAALAAKDAAPCPHIRGEHGSQWCALAESSPEILRQAAQRVVDAWHTKSALDERAADKARIAELEEDSARYRWLREEDSLGRQIDVWSINDAASEASTLYGAELDAAIDLARKEKGAQV